MHWSFWLIDVPARIVDIWLFVYTVILAVVSLVTVSGVMAMLVLWWGFGVRWGW